MTTSSISKIFIVLLLFSSSYGDISFNYISPFDNNQNFPQEDGLCSAESQEEINAEIIDINTTLNFYKNGAIFIDARSVKLFQRGTIKNALSIPEEDFEKFRDLLGKYLERDIVVFCSGITCGKSTSLARKLVNNGFEKVYIFKEGYPLWKKLSFPIMKKLNTLQSDPYAIEKFFIENLDSETVIIDVRTKEEYGAGHLENSLNIPLKQRKENFLRSLPKEKSIIFLCKSGIRALDALKLALQSNMFNSDKLFYFDGDLECNSSNQCQLTPFIY